MRTLYYKDESRTLAASYSAWPTFQISNLNGYSVAISATETVASLAGTLKLQASNNALRDDVPNGDADANAVWVDIPGSSQAVSGTGTFLWNVSDANYRFFRIVYTRTTGTGSFSTYVAGKGPQS